MSWTLKVSPKPGISKVVIRQSMRCRVKQREFITLGARAQQAGKVYRVGGRVLAPTLPSP